MVGGKASRCVLISFFLSFLGCLTELCRLACLGISTISPPPLLFSAIGVAKSQVGQSTREDQDRNVRTRQTNPSRQINVKGMMVTAKAFLPSANPSHAAILGVNASAVTRSARNVRVRRLQARAGQNPEISDSRESRPFYCEYASTRG
jgi:hypothetical protein